MAQAKRLTASRIDALRPRRERYEIWDGEGFGVRVTPLGTKSFVWLYHFQGRPRRLTLGTYGSSEKGLYGKTTALADARLALAAAQKALEKGEDPGKRAIEAKAAERSAETVGQLCDDYLEGHAKPKKRSAGADERLLNRDILPDWRGRKAKDIARRDVVARLDAVTDRGSPVMANRLHSLLSRLFNFAVERGVVEHSPVAGVKKPHKEKPRERNLSADEIRQAWVALERSSMELNLRRATKALLVTGQRREAVLGMHEGEIDRKAKLWTIPGDRAKNGRPHIVPLSPLALEIIGDPPIRGEGADKDALCWIFPSPRTRGTASARRAPGPYRGASLDHAVRDLFIPRRRRKGKEAKLPPLADVSLLERLRRLEDQGKGEGHAEWDAVAEETDAKRWTPHDLRRTVSTGMRELGVSRDDVKLILNHADSWVTGRAYDKYEGLEEKRRALGLWAGRLSEIVSGETRAATVEELRRA